MSKKGVPVAVEKEDGTVEVEIEGGMVAFMEMCNTRDRTALEAMKSVPFFEPEFIAEKEKELDKRDAEVAALKEKQK
jgi:hypothetical protein